MPELPEVETIKRDLEREVVGKRIKTVEVSGTRSIRQGHEEAVHRPSRGRQGHRRPAQGQVPAAQARHRRPARRPPPHERPAAEGGREGPGGQAHPCHAHAAARGQLRFVDPRTFGEMFVSDPEHLAEDAPELATLGFDPLDEPISWIDFGRMLIAKPVQLKAFLMDQQLIAGIGNIYSDEILYAAGLRYDRMSRHPHDAGHPPALPRGGRGDARSREAPRVVARRRAVPRPVRTCRRLPERAPGVRPRGPGLPPLPKHDRTRQVPGPVDLLLPQLPGLSRRRRPLRFAPAPLAALDKRCFAHPAAHCAAIPNRARRPLNHAPSRTGAPLGSMRPCS